jgi:hypothetical protein
MAHVARCILRGTGETVSAVAEKATELDAKYAYRYYNLDM